MNAAFLILPLSIALAIGATAPKGAPVPGGSEKSVAADGVRASMRTGRETIRIYFTPLAATTVAADVGLGEAYHMAIVYTDAHGTSFGVSGGPSNLAAGQTPLNALSAILDDAECRPSAFGTLVSDPHNDTAFIRHTSGDFYTHGADGVPYPHKLVARGRDLSASWRKIVRTYARIGRRGFTYSPIEQNSNSLAATALTCAGYVQSHERYFTPGMLTSLDACRP